MSGQSILSGAIFGFLAVAAGAFGAHALRGTLSAGDMEIYRTAVSYQMSHALALVLYGVIMHRRRTPAWPAIAFVAGIVLFSGSLYLLVLTQVRQWGAVTPLGGIGLLIGWIGMAIAAWKTRHRGS